MEIRLFNIRSDFIELDRFWIKVNLNQSFVNNLLMIYVDIHKLSYLLRGTNLPY